MADNDKALQQAAQEEDARADLAAMLAAGRELGPDMDRALVESYLNRHKEEAKKAVATTAPTAPAPARSGHSELIAAIVMLGAMAAYCIVLVEGGWYMWWLIFPLMGWLGSWGFWGAERHSERRAARYDYKLRRRALRHEYRTRRGHGYGAEDEDAPDTTPSSPTQSPPTYHV